MKSNGWIFMPIFYTLLLAPSLFGVLGCGGASNKDTDSPKNVVAPSITSNPENAPVTVGDTATFDVEVTGTEPLSYLWKKNWNNRIDEVGYSKSYTTTATLVADNNAKFSVVVTNAAGHADSDEATLTVTDSAIFNVSFNLNYSGATGAPSAQTIALGGKVTAPNTPTRTSCTFGGWYREAACANEWNFASDTVTANRTLYAKWNTMISPSPSSSYIVSFNLNYSGANGAPANQTVTGGGKVTEPTAPTRSGFTFNGWYREAACTTEWNFTADIATGNRTLYAKWSATTPAPAGTYIADYKVAKDAVLRAIPDTYINIARTTLRVSYNHTSHGTHVSYGVYGLPWFKAGDDVKFGVTNTSPTPTKLFIDDHGGDLSTTGDSDWANWRNIVRAYLDNPDNAAINVVMWSWCDISGHSVPNYLSSMATLIGEYGAGGSKIGTGAGKRVNAVSFIFMTGHANGGLNNLGAGKPKEQAKLIVDYCNAHGYYCIDYYSIDTHAMDDAYYEDANDNAVSTKYGGNFYQDWQDSHTKGVDWYENRNSPGGTVEVGNHNTQHITANRKAFAFWWVLARIAGYR